MDIIRVTEINYLDQLTLGISFSDGLVGELDFAPLLTGPIFTSLSEASKFATATVQYGTIVWDGDIDMAPEYLYSQMKQRGRNLVQLDPVG